MDDVKTAIDGQNLIEWARSLKCTDRVKKEYSEFRRLSIVFSKNVPYLYGELVDLFEEKGLDLRSVGSYAHISENADPSDERLYAAFTYGENQFEERRRPDEYWMNEFPPDNE